MRKTLEKKQNKNLKGSLYKNFIELLLVGAVTGIIAGAIVTVFNILVHEGEHISRDVYAYVRTHHGFIPLLFLALVGGAFLLGVAVNISSVIRGCGIPQAEGATRGIVPLKWWRDMTAMFAACLLSVFMGLSIGAEGPSVLIGASAGDGVAASLKRNQMIRKYQAASGACTGLAVAGGAPLTGVAFAFEEAYKRLTPEVFICSAFSVIFGMLTRTFIYFLLDMEITNAFHSYVFADLPYTAYGYVALAGIACGVLGVLFYKLCFALRKLFKMIKVKNEKISHGVRILIAVVLGGVVSLITVGAMGGGHELIESLGSNGGVTPVSIAAGVILTILILKFFITTVNVGSGIPCGIFIPIIAIGACSGAIMNKVWLRMGMDSQYWDLMVMICMAAFFTAVVKAPITSIVMICEFTGSFAHLLPVIIAVSIAYIIGEMCRTDGIYEELLEQYEHEAGIHEHVVKEMLTITLLPGALADKREVRDVLWPKGTWVTSIRRGEKTLLPDGDTILHGGDQLVIVCKTDNPQKSKEDLLHILE